MIMITILRDCNDNIWASIGGFHSSLDYVHLDRASLQVCSHDGHLPDIGRYEAPLWVNSSKKKARLGRKDKSITPKDKAVVAKAEADACCTIERIVVERVNAHARERAAAEV
ncbi:hypothetical protein Tco_0404493 [Tanacetum coccineum]